MCHCDCQKHKNEFKSEFLTLYVLNFIARRELYVLCNTDCHHICIFPDKISIRLDKDRHNFIESPETKDVTLKLTEWICCV